MTLREFQEIIRKAYFERDSARGLDRTFIWFIEEVGELARAIKSGDMDNIEEEIADVAAWLVSIANLLDVDFEKAILKKYRNPPK
ncbi:MAG: nucleotide pyrophosphohydrolase [Thermoprotei archaeon]|nr:MAG: nucleotide pyrophosphohydrolase [Thermoprotei archaeon]